MRIGILIPPDAHGLEVAGMSEVFDEANRSVANRSPYEVSHIGVQRQQPVRCSSGLCILPDSHFSDARPAPDTLIVAATYGIPEQLPQVCLSWIRETAQQARRFGAVCTGAFTLGYAGLLDGRHATTHWAYAEELARRFPQAEVEPDRIFIRDGAMFTSAGVTAALDLALDLVEEDLGREVALQVARRLVVFLKRPGGQTQYSIHLAAQEAQRGPIQKVQQLIRDMPRADLSLPALARHAGVSERNLSRVFRQETGMSVGDYVTEVRLDAARRLLEETRLPLKNVAFQSGFGTAEALRRAFMHRLGITPAEYRARFRSVRDSA